MKHKVKCRPLSSAFRGGSPPSPPLATPLPKGTSGGACKPCALVKINNNNNNK